MGRHLILTGMPGCGKTTVGRLAAGRLGVPFYDLDLEIERKEGMRISELFSAKGEAAFRQMEAALCRELAGWKAGVIATGGGVVLRPENIAALRQAGLVVFLDRPVDRIAGDVDCASRPLLRQGPGRVWELYQAREPLYRQAAHCRVGNKDGPAQAAAAVAALWNKR